VSAAASESRPTALSVKADSIPAELKRERRWVIWKYVKTKDGRWTKPLFIATAPQSNAKSTDPSTWRTFDEGLSAYHDGKCDGIGFVLGDGYVGFDADGDAAPEILQTLNTYSETSPSGKGVHAIARGSKPDAKCRTGNFELYDRGRYFTVTGHHIPGLPTTVEERTDQIAKVYDRLFEKADETPKPPAPAGDDDDALIRRMAAAKNGEKFKALWRGDITGYPSPSEATSALCGILAFWTNKDPERMDRLFRKSGLMRSKWDDRRGDSTWGKDQIATAIASTKQGFTGGTATNEPPRTRDLVVEDLQSFWKRLEGRPELSWHVPGLIPDEGICLWHGQPRDFKSWCALEVTLALAAGRAAFSSERFRVSRAIKVAYFTEEDPERLIAARTRWLTAQDRMPLPDHFYPIVRKSLSFDVEEDRDFIIKTIQKTGVQVAVFDPVRSYTGLADKGPADLRPVAQFLRRIQNETTAKTLLCVHHDTKPPAALREGQERSRSQQASGGGIFSISDCPVAFEKLDWNKVAVYPEDYKLSGDPAPFEVTFETDERDGDDGPRFGSYVKPVARTSREQDIANGAAAKKILKFLRSSIGTWYSTEQVNAGARLRNDSAGGVLQMLLDEGLVLFCTGDDAKALGRSPRAKLWSGIEGDARQSTGDADAEAPF
jgi:putative DNA primase/helicase